VTEPGRYVGRHRPGERGTAGKQDVINHARKNNAPDAVIQVLEMFQDMTFQSATDVSQKFDRIK